MNINKQHTRRNFMEIVSMGAASLTLPGWLSAANTSEKMPNILFLFTDDQRFDTIHALGNEHIITPNMDSLVETGPTFTNAYIMGSMSGAVCMPSRAMLMTGRTLFHLQDDGNIVPEEHITLPEILQNAGYTTFETGKWHQDKATFKRCFTAGEKIFFGGMSGHYKVPVNDFDPTGEYPKDKIYSDEGTHSSELFSDAAIRFLKNYKNDKPFFMYVSFTAPHDPREMPKEYMDMYDPGKIPLPENFLSGHPFDNGDMDIRDEQLAEWPRTPEEIRRHIAAYYAMITHVDEQIGRILDTLKETGQAENTIIVFSGDNGLAVGQHGLLGKQNLYEHSVHVPLVICGSGIPAGEKRDAFCYLPDIFPTLCDLTGIPIPASVEGKSLAPVIWEEQQKLRESMFFAYKNFQRAVRTDRWKLILYNVNGKKTIQLFDLLKDPCETKNLAGDSEQAYLIHGLTALMKDWFKETGDQVDLDKPDWGVPVIPSWQNIRKQRQSK